MVKSLQIELIWLFATGLASVSIAEINITEHTYCKSSLAYQYYTFRE